MEQTEAKEDEEPPSGKCRWGGLLLSKLTQPRYGKIYTEYGVPQTLEMKEAHDQLSLEL